MRVTLSGSRRRAGASRIVSRYLSSPMAGRTLIRIVLAVTALAVLSAMLLTGGASGAGSRAISVSAKDDFFDPQKVAIGQGEKVTWTNEGSEDHTVKFKGQKNKVFAPGESVSVKFKDTGRFKYHCTLHAGMTGKVVAKDVR
jgi:plastocyanin